jgi:hypothetical protein
MEHHTSQPVVLLKQQINQQKKNYRQAIKEDRQFAEAKQILDAVALLETELESLFRP